MSDASDILDQLRRYAANKRNGPAKDMMYAAIDEIVRLRGPADPPGPLSPSRRTDLAKLRRYASGPVTQAVADMLETAAEEIGTLRGLVARPPQPEPTPPAHTQAEHKAEAERLLALAHQNHRVVSTSEDDADVAADQLRGVALVLAEAQVHATLASIPERIEVSWETQGVSSGWGHVGGSVEDGRQADGTDLPEWAYGSKPNPSE